MIAGVIAGRLRHRVYIRNPVITTTAKGDQLKVFDVPIPSTDPDAWASIEPLVGRELIVARGIRADVSHKIMMRFTRLATQLSRIYWYDGVDMLEYHLGPLIDRETRHIYVSYYAVEIR